jgi:hypothetical protein
VLGLRLDGSSVARAYPLNLLAYHRVVLDVLDGRSVVVAFSPLSESARCSVLERDERLRASGKVHQGDDLLVDDRTGSLWSVLLGSAVLGPRAGEPLARRGARCAIMTWAAWRALAPPTTVAWPRRAVLGFDYRRDPWAWYRADDGHLVTALHYVDLRLPRKQMVLGVALGGEARAFLVPGASAARAPIAVNTRVGGEPVIVLLDGRRRIAAAYLRRAGGGTARFSWSRDGRQLVDDRTGSRWNALGEAVAGPLAGERLEPAPGSPALFFAWAAHHPGTAIERREQP